jgi:nicotinate phosphoribosyltransferase
MILKYFTDNDLYKFTTMNAIQKLYPKAMVRYRFINRGDTIFPDGFAEVLREELTNFSSLVLNKDEEQFMASRCYFFDPVFIDLLKGYRYDPDEVKIDMKDGKLSVLIEGLWYRTVLWEVPLLAVISELYYIMTGQKPREVEERAVSKAQTMRDMKAEYSDFGTRRRFSFDVHDQVVRSLKQYSGEFFKGTSNLFLAMKHNLTPIGTHPHEWFMFHAAHYGYRSANARALDAWVEVYKGDLGIALSDTFTSDNFFDNFSVLHAKLFDGVRQDSGDPVAFTEKALKYYIEKGIDPVGKTVVFSDSLTPALVQRIKKNVNGRIHDVYGIGTYLTNDAGVKPLNIVIKITDSRLTGGDAYHPAIKLSDDREKHTGDKREIELCKKILGL